MKKEQKTITNANEGRQNKLNVPTLRFKEYSDTWQETPFDSTFDILTNNTLSRAELNHEDGTYKNIHYGDVLIKFPAHIDVEDQEVPFVNEDSSSVKFDDALLQDGDIVIADTAEDYTVGKATEIENSSMRKVVSGLHTIPCRPKMKFAARYLGYYYKAILLMTDEEIWQYIKAIYGYMVDGVEPKELSNNVALYFNLAKKKLDISKTRSIVGKHGGKLRKQTAEMTLEQFLSAHPHIRNNLYGNAVELVKDKDFSVLSDKLKASSKWASEQSLYKILSHYDEIVSP